jgi:polysaccharide pyruvyl transferase CsaB
MKIPAETGILAWLTNVQEAGTKTASLPQNSAAPLTHDSRGGLVPPHSNLEGSVRIKALMLGYYGACNLGDELMLYCLRRWLEAQGVTLSVLSENPDDVQRRHNLPAILNVPLLGKWGWYHAWFRGAAWKLLGQFRSFDLLVGGGGDCIRDDCGHAQFWFSVEKYILALLLRKRICMLNVGLGRLRYGYARRVLSWILKRSSMTVVRDRRSVEVCRSLGITHVHYAPDIVATLPKQLGLDNSQPPQICRDSRPYALVCLRDGADAYGRYVLSGTRLEELARALDHLVSRYDLDVKFMPFQSYPGGIDDNRVHHDVTSRMSHRDRAHVFDWNDDLSTISRHFTNARCVVAMRLHAAILATAFRRPCTLMPYDQKLVEFGDQVGIHDRIEAALLDCHDAAVTVLDSCMGGHETSAPESPPDSWETLRL